MTSFEPTFLGGVLLGLASALHCGAMCSGICGSALLFLNPKDERQRATYLALLQAGRITTYAALGAVGALIGSSIITPDIAAKFKTLQWAAAIALVLMGLAISGLLPRIAVFDRGALAVSRAIERLASPLRRWPRIAPFGLGMMWGGNACPMVYGAVFTATLTGSVVHGVMFMLGFGVGTVPAVVAAAYGLSKLKTVGSSQGVQMAAGLSMATVGFASIYSPWPAAALAFCISH